MPAMNKVSRFFACCLLLLSVTCEASDNANRIILFPKFRVGQTLRYQIGYRAATNTNTESTVAAPMAPTGGQVDAHVLLQVDVQDIHSEAGKTIVRLRTRIVDPDAVAPTNATPHPNDSDKSDKRDKVVEFTLHSDGQVTDLDGFDKLSADEQSAWQEWVSRFGGSAALPEKGLKLGEKWKSEEPITSALLAGLSWEKESQYVNDAPCGKMRPLPQGGTSPGAQTQETCAVILTTATLKQKSSQKDATPEDYKLHDLRTMGIAKGKNEIITYISLKTGFVQRATEDANQSMNVIVAKVDGSNRVHYQIDAESHAQVLLLAELPAKQP